MQDLTPFPGDLALDRITRQDIIAFLNRKQQEGKPVKKEGQEPKPYSPNALRLMLAPLSRLFSDAYDAGLVRQNPCLRPGRIVQVRGRRKEIVALTEDEERRLLKACRELRPDHYALFCTLFWSGVRFGEAVALEWQDVDFEKAVLRISKNFTNGHLIETPKSGRNRRVDLSRELIAVLKKHRTECPKDARLAFPGKKRKKEEKEDPYLDATSWRRRVWDPVMREAKLPTFTPHVTRHTYATRQLEKGASLAWLKGQLGHSSIQVTVDVYGHLADDRLH